ncbi:MAG: endopeptidase La [Desulfobacteraceae bacterium]|nr:MAG: endopeptidase La [Desulfobacteraceae bacterium]
MTEPTRDIALKEVDRLSKISPSSTEYTIGLNHIEYLASLPWGIRTDDKLDIEWAQKVLDTEHAGLHEVKERILEFLAVRILKLSGRHSILVIDDEETTCKNLKYTLNKEGYQVETLSSGEEALSLLEQRHFDIVITDLKMKQIDGLTILNHIKSNYPSTEVIIITGYATVDTAVDALTKGSYQFLAKPLKLETIRSTVKKALSQNRLALDNSTTILCFSGPPGTGKTSLGRAIAKSLNRKFIRISLAGIKDEADIRGHRRSYTGALPGRIIQEIRRCESQNPLIMLDEIDKLGNEFKGDPAAALLEVLDPEQNRSFIDHYLDVPFDLSDVMFIATANIISAIPAPLLDRFEVIHLSGYTHQEKRHIAFNHMIPKAVKESGLTKSPPVFSEQALDVIIKNHTREAGLRDLERKIAAVCRKISLKMVRNNDTSQPITILPDHISDYLGPKKYFSEVAQAKNRIGLSTGLAWTQTGGEIIFIEATAMEGRGQLILTGSLGEVMKESAQAALSYIRSHTDSLNLPDTRFDKKDIHIHVPAGAIQKDGPSAGITIAAALVSLFTRRVCRRDVALSGELTLSGRILPVGGIKEKILAASEAGISTLIFPEKNLGDIQVINDSILSQVNIITANDLSDIIDHVLL